MTTEERNGRISFILLIIFTIPLASFPEGIEATIKYIKYFSCACAIILFFGNRLYLERNLIPIWAILFSMTISTIINHNGYSAYFGLLYTIFSSAVFTYTTIDSFGYNGIKWIGYLFAILAIIQGISFVSGGLGTYIDSNLQRQVAYFFGIRVEYNNIFIFFISLAFLIFRESSYICRFLLILGVMSSILFIFGEWVSTALVTILVFAIVLILRRILKSERMWRNLAIFTILLVMVFYFTGSNISLFAGFIENVLHRNITLSGRTYIWEQAISDMKGWHWIIGNGFNSQYRFYLGRTWSANTAHSQYLNILFYLGICGFVAYFWLLTKQFRTFFSINNDPIKTNVIATTIAILVMGISTTTFRNVYLYVYYIVVCMIPILEVRGEFQQENTRCS